MTSIYERRRDVSPVERLAQLPFEDSRLGIAKRIVEQAFGIPRPREALTSQSIVEISMNVQNSVADELGIPRDSLRTLTAENVETTIEFLSGEGGRSVKMRHGAQQSDTTNKLYQMKPPRNREDFLTAASMAESAGTATAMALILQIIRKQGRVHTSSNNRSSEVAILLAAAMRTVADPDRNFDCVNYRDDMPNEGLNKLIGVENNGSAAWDERIDEICADPGLYHKINALMSRYVGDLMHKEGKEVHFYITHTQQTQALDLRFGDKPSRLDELGFRMVSNKYLYEDPTTRRFKSGLYRGE